MRRLMNFFKSAKLKRGQPRPRVKPLWRRPVAIAMSGVLSVSAVIYGGWWIWQQGWIQQSVESAKWQLIGGAANVGFAVDEIFVEGRVESERKNILAALRLKRGAPILAFDPIAAKQRIELLPWIKSASIERQLPDVIHLKIVERRPMALWQRQGKFSLIDTDGQVIKLKRIARFGGLIVVVGRDAPAHAANLFETLATQPLLAKRVKAAVRVGGRRWNLHLANKVSIRLPENETKMAWRQLADMEKEHGLLERGLVSVDLRLPDRIVVREKTGKGQDPLKTDTKRKSSGRET
jgi:cell division protein FtsQ